MACSNGVPIMVDGAFGSSQPEGVARVCSGVEPEHQAGAVLADWLRGLWRRGGGGTGAYALARTGILKGRRFTLHWENLTGFAETFPDLTAVRQVFCIDGRIVTCAGGVAAADLMLEIIHERFGITLSQEVKNMCLLAQRRWQGDQQLTSLAVRLGTRHGQLIEAVAFLEARIEEPFDLDACAKQLGLSRRQIERLFSRYTGVTPVR